MLEARQSESIALGFRLGFGGAMTYERALRLRDLAAWLPAHSIVPQTDAPDMPPVWMPRQRNVSANLVRIAATLAELRGTSVEDVAAMTTANALAVIPGLRAPAGLSRQRGD